MRIHCIICDIAGDDYSQNCGVWFETIWFFFQKHTHTCAHTNTHSHTRTHHIHTHARACTQTHSHAHTHTHTHTHTRAHTHTRTHTHTHTHTHKHTHNTHTRTHTHTHTQCIPHLSLSALSMVHSVTMSLYMRLPSSLTTIRPDLNSDNSSSSCRILFRSRLNCWLFWSWFTTTYTHVTWDTSVGIVQNHYVCMRICIARTNTNSPSALCYNVQYYGESPQNMARLGKMSDLTVSVGL